MKRTRKCTFPLEKAGRICNTNNPSLESFDWCEAGSAYESIWVPKLKQKGKGAIRSYRHTNTKVSDRSEGRLLSLTAKHILIFFSDKRDVAGTSWSKTLWIVALSEITYQTSEKMLEVITEQFYLWFESPLIKDFIEEFFDWTQSEIYTHLFCFKCFLYLKICFLQYCTGMLPCTLCYATSVYFEISNKNPGASNQNMN